MFIISIYFITTIKNYLHNSENYINFATRKNKPLIKLKHLC